MTLYIDIENKKLVQSLTSDRSVPIPTFMQGDNEPLELHLLEKGDEILYKEKSLVVGTDFLRIAIARFKGYPKSLTYASGYTLNANGGAEIVLPLNTTAIEQAVQDNEYITAFLEVEYSNTEGKIVTILQTSCRLKNDLVDNAPSIELRDQFYDKVYIDEIFSKKSANLSDLSDKTESRKNLDVYSKGEIDSQETLNLKKSNNLSDVSNKATARTNLNVYSKSEVDSQESLNLKKANNLSDVSDVEQARLNLDVPQNRDLIPFGMSGVYSTYSSNVIGYYGAGLADDMPTGNESTFLTTYLGNGSGFYLYRPYNSDYYTFSPSIRNTNLELSLGYDEGFDEETGEYFSNNYTVPISKPFEFGDKIALIVKDRNFRLYKNLELVSSGEIPENLGIYAPSSVLDWSGLKRDLLYSNSLALPITIAEANVLKLNYSVESFLKGIYPPTELFDSRFTYSKQFFDLSYSETSNYVKATGGNSFENRTRLLKLTPVPYASSARSRYYKFPSNYFSIKGLEYKVSFIIYVPANNPNINKVQFRIGYVAPSSAGEILGKSDSIDDSGFIQAKNEWQTVSMRIRFNGTSGAPTLYFYKDSNQNFKLETETTDAIYLRDIKVECTQGIECFYYGASHAGAWKNLGCSNSDINFDSGYSYPSDVSDTYIYKINVSEFTYGVSLYLESFLKNLVLTKIILKFDSDVVDTSDETLTEKNVIQLTSDYELNPIYEEHLPAIPSRMSYILYPKKTIRSFNYLTIDGMNCYSGGGTIDFVFTKEK